MHNALRSPAIWFHSLFWLAFLLILPTFWHGNDATPPLPNALPRDYFIITNIIQVGVFYGVAYGLFPRRFKPGRWWLYLISVAVLTVVVYYLKLALIWLLFPDFVLTGDNWRFIFFPTFFFIVTGTIFRLGANHFQREREQQQRQSEHLASELKFLRSQVNPHFLFNVLNNLVALARKKSDLLEPALIKLSGLMRYMLYESNHEPVPLERELAYLNDFIDLQRLRFDASVAVQTDINLPALPFTIEPMLLIPFVENAFKHGLGWVTDPYIKIQLWMEKTTLHFTVENRYNPEGGEPKDEQSGIGLTNVRKRLPLLYPNRHQLRINTEQGVFSVRLTLQLA
jgi:two-component system LytT family sensor kinase